MAYTTVATGQTIEAAHHNEIVKSLNGTSGYGQAVSLTQLNDASNYALDARNLDSSNGYVARFKDEADVSILTLTRAVATFGKKVAVTVTAAFTAAADMLAITATWNAAGGTFNAIKANITNTASAAASKLLDLQVGGTSIFSVSPAGLAFLNDSANAKMTVGLTINEAGNHGEVLALKSSDVAHGVTDYTETDTFGALTKVHSTAGGLGLWGYSDGSGATAIGAAMQGVVAADTDTTKTTNSVGAVLIAGQLKSGTGATTLGADQNLMVIRNASTARFIFDAEGSAHGDVEWIAFDDHDDVALLDHLDAAMTKDPVKTSFGQYMADYQRELQDAKIVNFYDPGGNRAMVNFTRLAMLHTGAIRQLGQKVQEMEVANARIAALEARLQALQPPQGM